jgi:CRP-like cAMP-binding protein
MTFQFRHDNHLHVVDGVIFHAGDDASLAYVIRTGEVELYTTHKGVETVHERLDAGEIIGEGTLVAAPFHDMSARAVGEVTLREVTESNLDNLREELQPRSWAIVSLLVMRLHASMGVLRAHGRSDGRLALEAAA